jgi:hypothetical protein
MPNFVKARQRPSGNELEVNLDTVGGGGSGGSGGQLLYAEAEITPAEFYNMSATPKTIVPAVPGKGIILHSFSMAYKVGTSFSPSSVRLTDVLTGGIFIYQNCVVGVVGPSGLIATQAGAAELGASGVGKPFQIKFDQPFTAGALNGNAIAAMWYLLI